MSLPLTRRGPGARGSIPAPQSARDPRLALAALVLAPVIALFVARLLPPEGLGLWLRLGAAMVCVLVVPGALLARAVSRVADPALTVAAAIPWSLVAVFVALIVTFAAHGSLTLTTALLGVISGGALVAALATVERHPIRSRPELVTALVLLATGLLFGLALWLIAPPINSGDALEHLARTRKLAELPRLGSGVTELFKGATLHPGYAFPLWHGALALISRVAGLDPALVMRWLPALLAPLSFLATYVAGTALFRTPAAGVAAVAGQLASFGLADHGTGQFLLMAQPHQVTLLILIPSVLALLFTFVESGDRSLLASLGAASFSIAVVHPSYALFVCIPVLGFLAARLLLTPRGRPDHARIAVGLAAMAAPAAAFFIWLVPAAVRATPSFTPGPAEVTRQIANYGQQIQVVGRSFRMAPLAISTHGPAAVAALLAIPCALLAVRARWAAFLLGSGLSVLAILLVPPLFREFTNVVSISQGRRLALFLPWSFAFAGGALLLGRLRLAGVLSALGAGLALQHFYPGDFSYGSRLGGGPAWPVWFAAVGGGAVFVAGIIFRRWSQKDSRTRWWAVAVALAFITPVGTAGFADMHVSREQVRPTQGLIAALRTDVRAGDIVLAPVRTSYSIVAYAPVYVVAVPIGHAWDRPNERVRDVMLFFSPQASLASQEQILRKYGARWLVVDALDPPANVDLLAGGSTYVDQRYALYRLLPP